MTARIVIVAILLTALAAGVAMYWLQVYAFYDELSAPEAVPLAGLPAPVPPEGFRGIDSDSSPIRYRACFTLPALAEEQRAALVPYAHPTPLNAPGWFDCFDARAIDEAIVGGAARAVLGEADVHDGVDRVVALYPDGRAFAWNQINPCGSLADEDERPADCPADGAP